ncbi:hypothetical protein [Hydrogenimonas sp.]
MTIRQILSKSLRQIVASDPEKIRYLLFYAVIEGVLALVAPLASSFIVNAILAHATISIAVLGGVVLLIVLIVTFLQLIKEYIVEKFQQKIFVGNAVKVALSALKLRARGAVDAEKIDKYMN